MSKTILIVDDSMMVRQRVGQELSAVGFTIVEAADGVEAIERLRQFPDTKLVVCDVNMPRMNGIEFLEALAAKGGGPPVVMLTTEGESELMRRAKSLGAKGWLVKPFKPDLLVATARKLTTPAT
jgi:two-component system chemotaxis response regulator CheY